MINEQFVMNVGDELENIKSDKIDIYIALEDINKMVKSQNAKRKIYKDIPENPKGISFNINLKDCQ